MISATGRRRILILGAAGRDFPNFNVVYRNDPAFEAVAFTAAQIPDIAGHRYPLPWPDRCVPTGSPSSMNPGWKRGVLERLTPFPASFVLFIFIGCDSGLKGGCHVRGCDTREAGWEARCGQPTVGPSPKCFGTGSGTGQRHRGVWAKGSGPDQLLGVKRRLWKNSTRVSASVMWRSWRQANDCQPTPSLRARSRGSRQGLFGRCRGYLRLLRFRFPARLQAA